MSNIDISKIKNYKTKSMRSKLLTYFKYLLDYNDNNDIVMYVKENKFEIYPKIGKVTLSDIIELDHAEYEGMIVLSKELIDQLLELEDGSYMVKKIEYELKDDISNTKKTQESYSEILNSDNLESVLSISMNRKYLDSVEKFMDDNKDGYHDFFYIECSNPQKPKLRFRFDVFDDEMTDNIAVNKYEFKTNLFFPYEIIDMLDKIQQLDIQIFQKDDDHWIVEYQIKFDICNSKVVCLVK